MQSSVFNKVDKNYDIYTKSDILFQFFLFKSLFRCKKHENGDHNHDGYRNVNYSSTNFRYQPNCFQLNHAVPVSYLEIKLTF